jgi:hypothetical protein
MSEILSKYALPGGEIELKAIGRAQEPEDSRQRKAHRSHVLKVLTENRVEVAMPIEAGKLILLRYVFLWEQCGLPVYRKGG